MAASYCIVGISALAESRVNFYSGVVDELIVVKMSNSKINIYANVYIYICNCIYILKGTIT